MKMNKGVNIARHLCLLPGIFLIVSGIMLLFLPIPASVLFDSKIQGDPATLSWGIRQLAIGLMITALSLSNQTKALAYVMLIGSIVPLTDFIVFANTIGIVSALRHFGPVPLILGLGIYILFQLKNKKKTTNNKYVC